MNRQCIWKLTVHWYPRAAHAGVQPMNTHSMVCEQCPGNSGTINPAAFYHPYEFLFANPPSRKDFIALVASIPWAANWWESSLIPLIETRTSQWPMITMGIKASQDDILDTEGRKVGHIHVQRVVLEANKPYDAAFVGVEAINRAISRIGPKREEARLTIWRNENWIRERTMDLANQNCCSAAEFVDQALREFLVKEGFIQHRKSRKVMVHG